MALTGIQIFKLLPKTNCGECGTPTCLAFAMKLAAKGVKAGARATGIPQAVAKIVGAPVRAEDFARAAVKSGDLTADQAEVFGKVAGSAESNALAKTGHESARYAEELHRRGFSLTETLTTTRPTTAASRAPCSSALKMSIPLSPVPSQCADDGGAYSCNRSMAIGS